MEATIVQDKTKHYPVLLKEIISIISPQYGVYSPIARKKNFDFFSSVAGE